MKIQRIIMETDEGKFVFHHEKECLRCDNCAFAGAICDEVPCGGNGYWVKMKKKDEEK